MEEILFLAVLLINSLRGLRSTTQLYTGAANLLFIDCTGHTLRGRACKTAERHVWHDRLTPRRTPRHRSTGLRSAFFNYRLPRVTWCRVRHTVKNRYVPINTSSRLKRFSRYVSNPRPPNILSINYSYLPRNEKSHEFLLLSTSRVESLPGNLLRPFQFSSLYYIFPQFDVWTFQSISRWPSCSSKLEFVRSHYPRRIESLFESSPSNHPFLEFSLSLSLNGRCSMFEDPNRYLFGTWKFFFESSFSTLYYIFP